jgi:hypothetical protein
MKDAATRHLAPISAVVSLPIQNIITGGVNEDSMLVRIEEG